MLFLILSVGRNLSVLRERHSTLIAAGYSVTSAHSKEEAMDKLIEGDFDLVLICPSLGKDRWLLVNAVRRLRPSISVVSIRLNGDPIMHDRSAYATACDSDEIVATVGEILRNEHKKFLAKRVGNARPHATRFAKATT